MGRSNSDERATLRTALAACKSLSAGTLCNLLVEFVKNVGTLGWAPAIAALSPATAAAVVAVAGLLGVTEAWQQATKARRRDELARKLDKLADRQENAFSFLCDIADGKIGLTLDYITQEELCERFLAAMVRSGLATSQQVERLEALQREAQAENRVYHETADWLLREIQKTLRDVHDKIEGPPPPPPRPKNNFAIAGIARNFDFVGREAYLKQLNKRLAEGNVALTHALSGEGGVGKTQIAIEFAHRHGGDYDGIWWVDASNEAVEASLDRLARTLGIDLPPDAKPDQIRRAICAEMSGGKHLLILDNLERRETEEDDPLTGFRLDAPSRVLVTTRRTDLRHDLAERLEIEVFQPDESLALFRKHRPDLQGEQHEAALGRVADHLGQHALAVTFAAAYLRQRPSVMPDTLLERLQRAEIGDQRHLFEGLDPASAAAGYRRGVAETLSLHLPDFADTPAMNLLNVAAFCHPDDIPIDLLADAAGLETEQVEEWLSRLADVSVLKYQASVSLHRLAQSGLRARLGADAARKPLAALVDALADRFRGALDYRNWPKQDGNAMHAQSALGHAARAGGVERSGSLGNQLGVYLQNRARFDDALSALRTAERIRRAAVGGDHPNVATTVNNIGHVLQDKGDLDGALACYREAERIGRATLGDDHPKVAIRVNNIGSVLQDKGDLDGALGRFRDAEGIDRAAFGDDHPEVAGDVNNIGGVLQAKGDLDGALACYREAERIDRAAYGDDHPDVATSVNNIGGVLQAKGDLDGAVDCYREAERIDRGAYGDDHPEVATDVNNMGGVLKSKGDLDGALERFREAERIDRAAYGDDHPAVARDVNNIGGVLRVKGDLDGALGRFREAERIDRAAFGEHHPEVATDINNIGSVLWAKGDHEAGREMAVEAFRIRCTTLGPRSLDTLNSARNLQVAGVDPIALARQIAGDAVAEELGRALAERADSSESSQ